MRKTPFVLLLFLSLGIVPLAAAEVSLTDIETAILEKDYEKAQALSDELVNTSVVANDIEQARYYKALSCLSLNDFEQARQLFTELRKVTQDSKFKEKVSIGIIDSFILSGQYTMAIAEAERFIKNFKDSEYLSLVYLKLGRSNLRLANWQKAAEHLRKVIQDYSHSLESHLARQLLEEKRYFTVQVGAFIDRGRAEMLQDEFKDKDLYVYIVETIDHSDKKFYRVRVGQLSTLREAENLRMELAQLGYPTQVYP